MRNEPSNLPAQVAPNEVPDEPLKSLAQKANQAHYQLMLAIKSGLLCAVEAGMALAKAKRLCPLGKWRAWLEENFQGSRSTAYRYLAFANQIHCAGLDVSALTHLPPHEADKVLAKLWDLSRGPKKKPRARGSLEDRAKSANEPVRVAALPQPAASASAPALATRFPPFIPPAEPTLYDRPAKDHLLRAEQLLDEAMMKLRLQSQGPHNFYVQEKLRNLEPIHADLARYNRKRRKQLLDAGHVLR